MTGETDTVRHEIRVGAPPERVFSYFTDPMKMVRWMGMEATLDPRPGGACRIDINGSMVSGRFVQIDPHWRIVFTWGFEEELFAVPPRSTAVEVSFTPDGDETIVRLTHCRLPHESVEFHKAGWEHYLARLAVAAAGGEPGPDPFADAEALTAAIRAVATRGE